MGEPHSRTREIGFSDRGDPDEGARQLEGTRRSQLRAERLGKKDLLKIFLQRIVRPPRSTSLSRQASKRDAHFDDRAKHVRPVPMEFDALLAQVTALNEVRGESSEAGEVHGTEPQFHETCGGQSQRHEEELMAVRGNKGGKGEKGGNGGKGCPGAATTLELWNIWPSLE